jgi:hypothetical protein
VLVHVGMAIAFRRADPTGLGTSHQLGLDQHWARLREP